MKQVRKFEDTLSAFDVLKQAIHEACLEAAKEMGPEKIKQMSWFGKNHK